MLPATLILLLPAVCYLLGAVSSHHSGWRIAKSCASMALTASLFAALVAPWLPLAPSPWLAASPLHLIMSVLVSLIGFVVVRFSINYLSGDTAEEHYRTWLQLCLASVSLVVVSDHLLMLVLAWSAISICLHQLLTSYPDRFRAVLAAHKKFIFARLADACLLTATYLLWQHHGTFQISTILAEINTQTTLTTSQQAAACLFALTALIKCAQLPVHGWLMQVVEAPTPVSALLHAGVINLGGFLMIMMAPLMSASDLARWLILIPAGLTTVLAALVMMTRISIKVRLAWSTSAQMGLMLVECALGLHELALLHLLAHSCYKAHAFLTSGNTVMAWLDHQYANDSGSRLTHWVSNLLIALLVTAAAISLLPQTPSPAEWSAWLLVTLALSFWLPGATGWQSRLRSLLVAVVLVAAYVMQKSLLASLLPPSTDASWLASGWIILLLAALLAGYGLLVMHPTALSYRWRQWLFAGFYLDEWVTRTTLKLWPVTLPTNAARKPGHVLPEESRNHERLA